MRLVAAHTKREADITDVARDPLIQRLSLRKVRRRILADLVRLRFYFRGWHATVAFQLRIPRTYLRPVFERAERNFAVRHRLHAPQQRRRVEAFRICESRKGSFCSVLGGSLPDVNLAIALRVGNRRYVWRALHLK